jgi:hypothetical protein
MHITKIWFDGDEVVMDHIPVSEIYKQEPDDLMAAYMSGVYDGRKQRTWVGLSETERNEIEDFCEMMIGKPAFDAIEAKLKDKNT